MLITTPIVGTSPTPCLLKYKESRSFACFLLDEIRIEIEGYWLATRFVQCRSPKQLTKVEEV